jgi:pSer/pThr/pTyr-binding forkhead associated (FHA) protein
MRFVFELRLDDGSVRRFSKSAERIYIGRASVNDIVLTSDLVSAQHALIDGSGTAAVLSDMDSTNGTYLNGNRVVKPANLKLGDVIAFGIGGSAIMAVTLEPEIRTAQTVPIRREDLFSQKRTVRVGRAADNDLVLDDASVSGQHARVVLDRPGHGIVEDLQSTNGVAVGSLANRVARGEFGANDTVFFGSAAVPAAKLLAFRPEPIVLELDEPVVAGRPVIPLWVIGAVAAICAMLLVMLGLAVVVLRGRAPVVAADSAAPPAAGKAPAQPAPPPAAANVAAANAAAPAPSFAVVPADVDKIAQRAERAVVWVGAKHKEDVFPLASAWAVKPNVLVTTAAMVARLDEISHEPDMKVVAWSNDSLIPVVSFETDPQYSASDPVGDNSLRHNVGLIRLEDPVPSRLEAASKEKRQALGPSTPLVLAGFYSTSTRPLDVYDRVKFPFNHATVTIQSAENDRPGVSPLYVVEVGPSQAGGGSGWLEGAPIASGEGTVVGILSRGTKNRLVLIDPSLWHGSSNN